MKAELAATLKNRDIQDMRQSKTLERGSKPLGNSIFVSLLYLDKETIETEFSISNYCRLKTICNRNGKRFR